MATACLHRLGGASSEYVQLCPHCGETDENSRSSGDGSKRDHRVFIEHTDEPRPGGRLGCECSRGTATTPAQETGMTVLHVRSRRDTGELPHGRLTVDLAASKTALLALLVKWWLSGPYALLLQRHRCLLSHLWYVDKLVAGPTSATRCMAWRLCDCLHTHSHETN